METWKEFDANELTHSAAHHLVAIHETGLEYGGWARVSDIARALSITRGSVSINLRALKKRGFVVTDEHRMVKLSTEGQRLVHGLMARKAAVKAFLGQVLGVSPEQAELDSCRIEHLISQPTSFQLIQLVRFLTSDNPAAREVLAHFQRYQAEHETTGETCPICHGPCLIEPLRQSA